MRPEIIPPRGAAASPWVGAGRGGRSDANRRQNPTPWWRFSPVDRLRRGAAVTYDCLDGRVANDVRNMSAENPAMWYEIERILLPLFRLGGSLTRHEWILVFVGALVVGFICMRGFGSRANY